MGQLVPLHAGQGLFKNLYFRKSGADIREKARDRMGKAGETIEKVDKELTELCKKYGMNKKEILATCNVVFAEGDDRYPACPDDVKARVRRLAQITTIMEQERRSMGIIVRELPMGEKFKLNFDEMEFFGF